MAGGGKLPVNVRVVIEGEEEVGGEGIAKYVREHGDALKADVALVSDTDMFAPDLPTLCVGMRGDDLYGDRGAWSEDGSSLRPVWRRSAESIVALAQVIAKLKDEDGMILGAGSI